MRSPVSAEPLRAQIQNIRPHAFLKQWHIHLTACFLLVSLAVPSIPFVPQSLALPCLDLAGCLAEDSGAPGSNTEPRWKPVCSDGQQQIQLHLSVAVKPAVWARGTRWDRRGGVCACKYVCVRACVCVNVSVSGGWRLQQRGTDWDVKREREREGDVEGERGREGSVSSSWASEQVLLYVSQGHKSTTRETQYKFGFISTPCIDLFGLILWGTWFKETIDGSQVKMSVLSSLTSCLQFESRFSFSFLFLHAGSASQWPSVFFSFHPSLISHCR